MARQEGIRFLLVAFSVILLDQAIKSVVRSSIALNGKIVILQNLFSITHASNTGIAFGLMKGYNSIFIWVYVMLIGLILYFYAKSEKGMKIPLALVLGAVIGNLIDRVLFGGVTDFIKVGFWPSFNIADASACIGVALLIINFWNKEQ